MVEESKHGLETLESLALVVGTAISLHSCCSFVSHVESNVGPGYFILGCNDEYLYVESNVGPGYFILGCNDEYLYVESNVGPGCFILGCNDEYLYVQSNVILISYCFLPYLLFHKSRNARQLHLLNRKCKHYSDGARAMLVIDL